jgi:acetyl esterase/lipase
MKIFLYIAGLALLTASCQKDPINGGPAPLAAKSETNVSYGADALQKMDVYLPGGRTANSTKVIILIHGGGWNQGDKADFASYVDTLKKRLPDYAIFNINYRLATGTTNFFPTQENDVKAAIDFIYSKRAEYAISDKFVYLGASAGAHLALLQAYKNTTTIRPKAVIDFFGPTDMVDMYNNPTNPLIPGALVQVVGGTPTTQAGLYASSSPINFVSAQSPPTIILHGGLDILVSPTQSTTLKTRLTTLGVVNQYVFYPTENHGWTGPNMIDSFDKIQAFLTANVN